MNRGFIWAIFAIIVYGATTVSVAQEEVLAPVLDGTHMDNMQVDPVTFGNQLVIDLSQVDSTTRMALDTLLGDYLPVLDGTHMDNMQVDPMAFVESVVQMDSASRVALEALSKEVSEGVMGYRVGLFFDNSSTARAKAQDAVALCDSLYGDVITTLSYANPYFKVSAGYCVTLEEALMLLNRMQRSFPKAFLISERIMPSHLVEVRDRELQYKFHSHMKDELRVIDSLLDDPTATL